MLVVVAIIVILAAILTPVLEVATKRAEAVSCLSNMRNLGMAARIYADDNDDAIVPARVGRIIPGNFGTSWAVLLQTCMHNDGVLLCPTDPSPAAASGTLDLKRSYGINYDVAMLGGYNNSALRYFQMDEETRTILFFELDDSSSRLGTSITMEGVSAISARHREGSNFTFADGHAKWMKPQDTLHPRNLWLPN